MPFRRRKITNTTAMEIVFLFLPSFVCLVVTCIIWSRRNLTLASQVYGLSLLACTFYLIFDGLICFPHTDPVLLVWSYIGLSFVTPIIHVAFMVVAWALKTQRQHFPKWIIVLTLLPCLSGVLQLVLSYGIGVDMLADYLKHDHLLPARLTNDERDLYDLFRALSTDAIVPTVCFYVTISASYLLYVLVKTDFSISTLHNFLFRKGIIRPMHLLILFYFSIVLFSLLRLHDNRPSAEELPRLCILFTVQAVLYVFMGLVADKMKKPYISLRDTHRTPYYKDLPVHITGLRDETLANDLTDEEPDSYRSLNLRDGLHEMMHDEACYLQPGMSRYSVSSRLGISRREFDKLIRLFYGVSYEVYVHIQRLEYYSRFRQQYPRISPETVATACGFPSVNEMRRQVEEWKAIGQEKPKK